MGNADLIGGVSPLKKVVKARRSGSAGKAATKTGKQRGGFDRVSKSSNRGGYNVNTRFKSRAPWTPPASGGGGTAPTAPAKPYSHGPNGGIQIINSPNFANINQQGGDGTNTKTINSTKQHAGSPEEGHWEESTEKLDSYKSTWDKDKDGIKAKYKTYDAYVKAAEEWWASDAGKNYKKKKSKKYVVTKKATPGYTTDESSTVTTGGNTNNGGNYAEINQ